MILSGVDAHVDPIRHASRRLVRELGFLRTTLAGTHLPASAVHALVEIGGNGSLTAAQLSESLALEKSSVSRMLRKLIASGDVLEAPSDQDGRAKLLSLTAKGRSVLAAIDSFARKQVAGALSRLEPSAACIVRDGLDWYAGALQADRIGQADVSRNNVTISCGYHPGVIGRAVEMHARFYARTVGFGGFFEAKVALEFAEFADRLDRSRNELWVAFRHGIVIGTMAIDGEDLGADTAHLRWFIVDDGVRGLGIGRQLLAAALDFCDRQGFSATQLWTFQGLDAARKLYDAHGFRLAQQRSGCQWGAEVIEQRLVRITAQA